VWIRKLTTKTKQKKQANNKERKSEEQVPKYHQNTRQRKLRTVPKTFGHGTELLFDVRVENNTWQGGRLVCDFPTKTERKTSKQA